MIVRKVSELVLTKILKRYQRVKSFCQKSGGDSSIRRAGFDAGVDNIYAKKIKNINDKPNNYKALTCQMCFLTTLTEI